MVMMMMSAKDRIFFSFVVVACKKKIFIRKKSSSVLVQTDCHQDIFRVITNIFYILFILLFEKREREREAHDSATW